MAGRIFKLKALSFVILYFFNYATSSAGGFLMKKAPIKEAKFNK